MSPVLSALAVEAAPASPLVELKRGDASAPLFVLSGAGGDPLELAGLAKRIESPCAVLAVPFVEGAETRLETVEAMAERAAALIEEAQPDGPIRLLGYSFGALVALEAARRLRACGREVSLLALVEPVYDRSAWPLSVWLPAQARRIGRNIAALRGASLREAMAQLRLKAGRFGARRQRRTGASATGAAPPPRSMQDVCLAAMARYRPTPYDGEAILIAGAGPPAFGCDVKDLWRGLLGRVEVERIPGDHLSIVRAPASLARLSRRLDARLGGGEPTPVLVLTTRPWHAPARLALALSEAGCAVRTLAPAGHVLEDVEFVETAQRLNRLDPLMSIQRALERCEPALIAPADDGAVKLLHAMHAAAPPDDRLRTLIEDSLGAAGGHARIYARAAVAEAARAAGVAAPETIAVANLAALRDGLARLGLPAVLKTDGSWGGLGTVVVRDTAEAETAFRRLSSPPSPVRGLKRLIVDKELEPIAGWAMRRRARVNLQGHVAGAPANAAVACWRGEVLACICVEAVETLGAFGPTTVARVLDHAQMREAARRMTRALKLSGLAGFDFILDAAGEAHLIEVNPRATPTAHLAGPDGVSPAAALAAALAGRPPRRGPPSAAGELIALFPQELIRAPDSEHVLRDRHDVPWSSPALVELGLALASRRKGRKVETLKPHVEVRAAPADV